MFLGFHKSVSTATASDRILKLLSLPPLAAQSKAVQPLMSPVLGSRPSSRRRSIVLVDSERLRDEEVGGNSQIYVDILDQLGAKLA